MNRQQGYRKKRQRRNQKEERSRRKKYQRTGAWKRVGYGKGEAKDRGERRKVSRNYSIRKKMERLLILTKIYGINIQHLSSGGKIKCEIRFVPDVRPVTTALEDDDRLINRVVFTSLSRKFISRCYLQCVLLNEFYMAYPNG